MKWSGITRVRYHRQQDSPVGSRVVPGSDITDSRIVLWREGTRVRYHRQQDSPVEGGYQGQISQTAG